MSVASLENGNLTLNSLTINNSQYAEALGYAPSTTILTSTVSGTAIGGSTNIATSAMYITSPSNSNNPYFSSTSNTMNLNVNPGEGLNITSGASSGSIIPTGVNTLSLQNVSCDTITTQSGGTSVFNNTQVNVNALQCNGEITTGTITTQAGGTSVFNDTQVNFNAIGLGGSVLTASTTALFFNGVQIYP